ncbi:NAD(P)H-dependent glycerol-3-phosphate dehydrogenase [Rhodosalinus sp.]|uniref:NAD(P)H-dependent glycerol-3-phosphate dehydrogenase n=1 Tax=Rhodosalinus sp. TaxID=2047741 RepID=UPI003978E8C9
MSVGILGAGAFGTALGIVLAQAGREVTLWAREGAAEMDAARENTRRLPGHALPEGLRVTASVDEAAGADTILLSVPMQKLRDVVDDHGAVLRDRALVACCKGFELRSTLGPAGVLAEVLPGTPQAILTGPSFAHDIAAGLPTALTLACADGALAARLQADLATPTVRLYRTEDVTGAELGGALKNVIAIACGAAMGAGLGESARAALMTRGFAEMNRMATKLGAAPGTLAGLSGFGDLALTCTSEGSRNYRYGLSLGRGAAWSSSDTVEGAPTARAVADRARALGVEMPITGAVVALLDGRLALGEAMDMLLSRPLREE